MINQGFTKLIYFRGNGGDWLVMNYPFALRAPG